MSGKWTIGRFTNGPYTRADAIRPYDIGFVAPDRVEGELCAGMTCAGALGSRVAPMHVQNGDRYNLPEGRTYQSLILRFLDCVPASRDYARNDANRKLEVRNDQSDATKRVPPNSTWGEGHAHGERGHGTGGCETRFWIPASAGMTRRARPRQTASGPGPTRHGAGLEHACHASKVPFCPLPESPAAPGCKRRKICVARRRGGRYIVAAVRVLYI